MSGAALAGRVRVERGGFSLDAEIDVHPGEVVALMGPSGSGKSTLFEALAGFIPLSGGQVTLDGQVIDSASGPHLEPRERGIVLLGQEPRLFPHLTARENIAFGPRSRRTSRAQARADADGWLERVGLGGMGSRKPSELSGGQQQRVALARALATSPRLLLLDEPLTSLDPATAEGIRNLLNDQLEATGSTAILATHHAADAVSLAQRLLVLENGRLSQSGTVREVLGEPATPFITVIAGTLPRRADDGFHARVERVEQGDGFVEVHARTADGIDVTLRLPPGTVTAPGATLALR